MKKLALVLVLLILLAAVPVAVYLVNQNSEVRSKAAPATTLSLSPALKTVTVGQTFTVDVMIETGSNQIFSGDIVLTYNPLFLEGVEPIAKGGFLPSTAQIVRNKIDPATGKITFSFGFDSTSAQHGTGAIATITFRGKAEGTSAVAFDQAISTISGLNENNQNLVTSYIPGSYVVSSASGTPTPTTVAGATPTPTTPAGYTPTPTIVVIDNTVTPTPTTESGSMETLTPTVASGSTESTPTPTTETQAESTPTPATVVGNDQTLAVSGSANGGVEKTNTPTIQGTAKPNSTITVVIHSGDPVTGTAIADANGNWNFTVPSGLSEGMHTITLTEVASDGSTRTHTTTFRVQTTPVPTSGSISTTVILISAAVSLLLVGAGIGFFPH